jgi:PAS domain S-box-containing protein
VDLYKGHALHDTDGQLAGFEGSVQDISERKRAEEKPGESDKHFRAAFDQTAVGMAQVSLEGRWLQVNRKLCEIFGYTSEELIGRSCQEITYPDDLKIDLGYVHQLLAGDIETFSIEKRYFRKDRSVVWVWLTVSLVRCNLGHPDSFISVIEDVTERKRREGDIRFLAKASEIFTLSLDFPNMLASVARLAVLNIADWCFVDIVEDHGVLSRVVIAHKDPEKVKLAQELQERYSTDPEDRYGLSQVLGTGNPKLFSDTSESVLEQATLDQDHPEILQSLGFKSYMIVPLIARERKLGAITLATEKSGRCYNSADLQLAKDLANRAALAIDNARLYDKAQKEIAERERAEEALRQSEELYRTVVEQAAENIFLIDIETERIIQSNAIVQSSLGYTAEELRRLEIHHILHDQEIIDPNIRRGLDEGSFFVGERTLHCRDGSLMHVEISVNTIVYGGREALCVVAHDITERKRVEESLRQSLSMLLALREAGQILGSTLKTEEIVSRLLEIMQRVSNLTATVISGQDVTGNMRVWRSVGLEGLWERARYEPKAEDARKAALETQESRLFLLQPPGPEIKPLVGLCLPLQTREQVIGVLEAYGPQTLAESHTIEILGSLASQAASALENAQLYGELTKREHKLQDLVAKLMRAQEEERRRVAYEVHDGLAQVAVAAHQHLQAFFRRYPPATQRGQRDLERVLRLVRQTVSDARKIIANLRPTALDDLGLAAAILLEVERLRQEGYQVDYEEELGAERLPATLEITLFRVAQEALTNARKHAQSRRIRLALRRRGDEVDLEIRDYGRGFDPNATPIANGPGERVGLAGMQERISMVGGKFKIHSQPGDGTSVVVHVPLPTSNVGSSFPTALHSTQ